MNYYKVVYFKVRSYYEIKEIEFLPGTHISTSIKQAIKLARRDNCTVKFKFNGTFVKVNAYSKESDVYDRWNKAHKNKTDSDSYEYKLIDIEHKLNKFIDLIHKSIDSLEKCIDLVEDL